MLFVEQFCAAFDEIIIMHLIRRIAQSLKNVPGEARTCLENENPCLEKSRIRASIFTCIFMLFYINIPFKLIVSDASRIAIKHECIFKNYFIVLFGCPINLIHARASKFQSFLGPGVARFLCDG